MSAITTHVLDTVRGRPAAGVSWRLDRRGAGKEWDEIARGTTDTDGRARFEAAAAGVHRLSFDTGGYFGAASVESFYPEVAIVFDVRDGSRDHHVPLLLAPFGYSTYRGS